jgi:hypothetical protein
MNWTLGPVRGSGLSRTRPNLSEPVQTEPKWRIYVYTNPYVNSLFEQQNVTSLIRFQRLLPFAEYH